MRFAPLALLLAANVALGQAPEKADTPKAPAEKAGKATGWKGHIVMGKTGLVAMKETRTQPDGTVVYLAFVGNAASYLVSDERENLVLIRTYEGREGWAEKDGLLRDTEAVAHFTKAIEDDPESAEAHKLRAIAQSINGKHDAAIADVTEAIRLAPKDWLLFMQRSNYWTYKHNYDKAIEDLDVAIRAMPGLQPLITNRAYLRAKKGDYAGAATDYEEILKKNDSHIGILNNLAWLLATCPDDEVRDGRRAVTLAEKAVQLTERKSATYLDTLAAAYAEARRFDDAVRVQQEALTDRRLVLDDGNQANQRLDLYRQKKAYREK
jgi:tetratricopeptide (TPR) repeat protein